MPDGGEYSLYVAPVDPVKASDVKSNSVSLTTTATVEDVLSRVL